VKAPTPKEDALAYLKCALLLAEKGKAPRTEPLMRVEAVQLHSFIELALESVEAIDEMTRKRPTSPRISRIQL
jgi:hypothetical protein